MNKLDIIAFFVGMGILVLLAIFPPILFVFIGFILYSAARDGTL